MIVSINCLHCFGDIRRRFQPQLLRTFPRTRGNLACGFLWPQLQTFQLPKVFWPNLANPLCQICVENVSHQTQHIINIAQNQRLEIVVAAWPEKNWSTGALGFHPPKSPSYHFHSNSIWNTQFSGRDVAKDVMLGASKTFWCSEAVRASFPSHWGSVPQVGSGCRGFSWDVTWTENEGWKWCCLEQERKYWSLWSHLVKS